MQSNQSPQYGFTNAILLVVFNYSDCIHNAGLFKTLYETHFKKIVFYADFPDCGDDDNIHDVNFVHIGQGYNTHNIFSHFRNKYRQDVDNCDGVFYTMDDNIINANILNLFTNHKIIYYSPTTKKDWSSREIDPSASTTDSNSSEFHGRVMDTLDNHTGWWWDTIAGGRYGKTAIIDMMNDSEYPKHNIDTYSGSFSDFFYLPKSYLTDRVFEMFDLFAKYHVFLEIAIPTIIHTIEPDPTQYQVFTDTILWGEDRDKVQDIEYLYHEFNTDHKLCFHPIKLNSHPMYTTVLPDILCKDKCVIITTINAPTESILKHIRNNTAYDVIIVGDHKTPGDEYKNLHCIYLDIAAQRTLFPELSDALPYNHYCRKNLGYLYAIKKGYTTIYETDDDNVPYDQFDRILQYDTNLPMIAEQDSEWINIFKYFTNDAHIWPRGYPLSLIKTSPNYMMTDTTQTPSIINGLVENDPDVDALFRLICNHQSDIVWETDKRVVVSNQNICVFNTQNTFWLNSHLFMSMLIPSSVSFRYCDILRGIISNIILRKTDNCMMYSSPNVVQNRNEHNLIQDFKSEYEMYIHNETIAAIVGQCTNNDLTPHIGETTDEIRSLMITIYDVLLEKGVIKSLDTDILHKWLTYF